MNARVGLLLVVLPGLLAAQVAVEYATGAGRAATTAAPAQKVGKAVAGAITNLDRVLRNSQNPKPAAPRVTARSKSAARRATPPQSLRQTSGKSQTLIFKPTSVPGAIQPKADPRLEDPSGIRESMEYGEILRRFGPPSLKLTTAEGEETLTYARNDLVVNAMLRNGKVATVQKTGGAAQAASALR